MGIALLSAAPAAAQDQPPRFRAGFTEWVLAGGFGLSVDLGPSNPEIQFLSLAPQWARALSPRVEYVLEAQLHQTFGPSGILVGVLPVGFRIYTGASSSRPYLSLGAGVILTDLTELEEIDRRFNFLLQAGFGVRWPAGERRSWLLEGRFHHLSNAQTAGKNLGVNSALLLVGYGFG
ncbi:MAG TPA: acyloxyacyl hydrolase [Acidobacteriota bacterium]